MSLVKQYVKSHRGLYASLAPAVRLARRLRPPKNARLSSALMELFHDVEGGSLIVRMADFNASFEMDCRSDILRRILIEGEYESEVVDLIKKRVDPERDAIDVGANAGLFTILLAKVVSSSSRVLAVEPTPGALQYLRNNIDRNSCGAKVIVFEGVAGSSQGEVTLKVISGKEEYSSIGNMVHPAIREECPGLLSVASDTIDAMVVRSSLHPGFIKIDAEGAEYDVLLGCEKTMLAHRPIILCESWDNTVLTQSGGTPSAVADLLMSCGYSVSQPIEGEILAMPRESAIST